LFNTIKEESTSPDFTKKDLDPLRGDFPAVNFGFTLPHRFNEPLNLNTKRHEEKVRRIRNSKGYGRISCFHNCKFPTTTLSRTSLFWYESLGVNLWNQLPTLWKYYEGLVWPCIYWMKTHQTTTHTPLLFSLFFPYFSYFIPLPNNSNDLPPPILP
jgi:hypothetical protein